MKPHHPAADLFPLMEGPEFEALVDDIRVNGQREAIWVDKAGRIIDGRNRARACHDLGIVPHQRIWDGDGSPIDFVVSLNLTRRHLDPSQRALLGVEIEAAKAEEADKRRARTLKQNATVVETVPTRSDQGNDVGRARDLAGVAVGVSGRQVAKAKHVIAAAPDLIPAVRAGTLPLARAERIIRDREVKAGSNGSAAACTHPVVVVVKKCGTCGVKLNASPGAPQPVDRGPS